MRWLLACLFLLIASTANASWYERWVEEKYQILVYPAPVWERCDHGYLHEVQPALHWEERTRTVRQTYWVEDPVVYVAPAPIYYSTTPVYSCPQPVYICPPVYVCPQPVYWYQPYGW